MNDCVFRRCCCEIKSASPWQAATIRPNAYSLIAILFPFPRGPIHHDTPSPRAARHDSAHGHAIRSTFVAGANRPDGRRTGGKRCWSGWKKSTAEGCSARRTPGTAGRRTAAQSRTAAAGHRRQASAAAATPESSTSAPAATASSTAAAPACARSTAAGAESRASSSAETRDASAAAAGCADRPPTAAGGSTLPGAAEAADCADRRACPAEERAAGPGRQASAAAVSRSDSGSAAG